MFDMNKKYNVKMSGNQFNDLAWRIHERDLELDSNLFKVEMRRILESYFTKNEVKT